MNGHFLLGDIHPIRYFLIFAASLGLVFFFISPTENIHWSRALLQWQLQAIIPMLCLILCHLVLSTSLWFQHLGHWYRLIISGVTGSAIASPFALVVEVLIANESWPDELLLGLLEEWAGMGVPVILSWLLVNAPILMGFEYRKQNRATPSTSTEQVAQEFRSPFLELTQLDGYGSIMALSSELHYLDVIEADSHQLVLYSLANAIAELPDDLGIQVHRSHWVAYSAIESFTKSGRQGLIVLNNGKEIPVSRANMNKVTAALTQHKS